MMGEVSECEGVWIIGMWCWTGMMSATTIVFTWVGVVYGRMWRRYAR